MTHLRSPARPGDAIGVARLLAHLRCCLGLQLLEGFRQGATLLFQARGYVRTRKMALAKHPIRCDASHQ